MFRPFLMLVLLGVVSGLVGVVVNLRRMEFDAEAAVHSIFPGVVAGALYGGIDAIVPTASAVAVVVAVALVVVHRLALRHGTGHDEAGTAVVLTSFFALGVVLLLRKGDMSGQLEALMFGRLLHISDARLLQSVLVCCAALVVLAWTWRAQIFAAFDEQGAAAAGLRVVLIDLVATACVAAVVVAASTAVGIVLVVGYLVIPGATARLVSRSVAMMTAVSIITGLVGGYLGMLVLGLPSSRPVSPQAAVALSMCGVFAVVWLATSLWRHLPHRQAPTATGATTGGSPAPQGVAPQGVALQPQGGAA
ncbi:metal ABC transporter permease [Corynebacterium sp. 13CS0277]|uniref:metal ABC transporter permease n=1 Tax=Corynebacterium sp. 13CS0277 TaxID=2071994 RepID=UPI001E340764|nr:metal ABC transporter permease [Corynebacterium sp. 13CS0277]